MGDRQTARIWDAVLIPIAPPTLGGRRDGERASILCTSKQQSLVSLLAKHSPNDLPGAGNLIVRSAGEEITNAVVQAAASAVHNLKEPSQRNVQPSRKLPNRF